VTKTRFDKMGTFIYSREEGTTAYEMPDQVPAKLKKQRLDTLMQAQREISRSVQESFIGKTLKVLIEEKPKDSQYVYLGRSEYDAPEVDGVVYVHSDRELKPGEFVQVKITDSYEYDLAGECV